MSYLRRQVIGHACNCLFVDGTASVYVGTVTDCVVGSLPWLRFALGKACCLLSVNSIPPSRGGGQMNSRESDRIA